MDSKTEHFYIKIIYVSLAAAMLYSALQAGSRIWLVLFLSGLLAFSATVRHMLLFRKTKLNAGSGLAYLPDMAVIVLFGLLAGRDGAAAFALIVLCDACLFCPHAVGYGIAGLCIAAYAFSVSAGRYQETFPESIPGIALAGGAFLAAMALITITRHELETRQDRDKTLFDLKTKSKQLEDAYSRLREVAKAQEDLALLRERARIAGEMHDTVGHALTNGLISLEAGERLMQEGQDQAAEKIGLAKEQLRNGLAELRQAVRAMGSSTEETAFPASLRALLDGVCRQGVSVHEDISELPKLSEQKQAVILRALQEGLTNGLRHGGSTAFVFQLKPEGGCISFLLEDNGRGCDSIAPGFGLKTMEERVAAAGGSLRLQSGADDGFRIEITMPVEE